MDPSHFGNCKRNVVSNRYYKHILSLIDSSASPWFMWEFVLRSEKRNYWNSKNLLFFPFRFQKTGYPYNGKGTLSLAFSASKIRLHYLFNMASSTRYLISKLHFSYLQDCDKFKNRFSEMLWGLNYFFLSTFLDSYLCIRKSARPLVKHIQSLSLKHSCINDRIRISWKGQINSHSLQLIMLQTRRSALETVSHLSRNIITRPAQLQTKKSLSDQNPE